MEIFSLEKLLEILQKYWPYFQNGLVYTLLLALFSVILGIILAIVITFMRMNNIPYFRRITRLISGTFIEIIRSTPILVQLMIIYLGVFGSLIIVPSFNLFGFIDSTRFIPGVVAIGINSAAYISEIIRGGINNVDSGQTEAARSLGMNSFDCMRFIVMPQAIRNILPALGNEFVVVIKESSIGMIIGLGDIMYNANLVVGATYRPLEPLIIASVLYFIITFPTSKLISYFEKRMSQGYKR